MYGFQLIPPETIITPAQVTNYRLATSTEVRDKVERQIREELQQGNYVITELKLAIVSALGAIPKTQNRSYPTHTRLQPSGTFKLKFLHNHTTVFLRDS